MDFCPSCGNKSFAKIKYSRSSTYRGLELEVEGLEASRCETCGYQFETESQHDSNVAHLKSAYQTERGRAKQANGLLSGSEIRHVRESLGITAKDASQLFGGGPNAFSRYEREEIVQSQAIDRLIRLVGYLGPEGLTALRKVASLSSLVLHQASSKAEAVDVQMSRASIYSVSAYAMYVGGVAAGLPIGSTSLSTSTAASPNATMELSANASQHAVISLLPGQLKADAWRPYAT